MCNRLEKNSRRKTFAEEGGVGGGVAFTLSHSLDNNVIKGKKSLKQYMAQPLTFMVTTPSSLNFKNISFY